MVTLLGGSFTGRGGISAYGLSSAGPLEAQGVSAVGEDASSGTFGLYNSDGGMTLLKGGSFVGRGGETARGVHNWASPTGAGARLEAKGISALGVEGSSDNWGLFNYTAAFTGPQSVFEGADHSVHVTAGNVMVSNSRLVGEPWGAEGTLTCVLVTRGSIVSADGVTCP